ncbi:hypothetical protein [Streptomyces rhizosphaerihabitans]|uniref:hypothetical protein n=1 Tax=Streptomyces rhizosphaerihabitans TaxID=1266770 RepID=UPI0021C11DC2|nr:hypothetical protein [Streptomyces rhizosphaerihabitans]MCT9011577.1 hypothetical protein [Streptomyces rhizosphaerihabitans]
MTATGNAAAASGGTAVNGYCGPAPGTDDAPDAPVHVSDTGDATATNGGTAISGYVGTLNVVQRAPQEPAPWPHQVGVIPLRAVY